MEFFKPQHNDGYPLRTKAKKRVLKWAVGSSDRQRSAIWRFWGNKKGDYYVSMQGAGGVVKASYHSDGNCQIGHTSEYWKQTMQENAGRHWNKWRLPENGISVATQILIPSTELRCFEELPQKEVRWIPTPHPRFMIVVSIFIVANCEEQSWLSASEGAQLIGQMQAGERTAWIVYKEQSIPEELYPFAKKGREIVANLPGAEEVLQTLEPRGCICAQNGDRGQFLLEVAPPPPK
jgi:hypothetical protein